MNRKGDTQRTLKAWALIPDLILASLEGLDEEQLDLRLEDGEWSIRETVHHLVEAQVVAWWRCSRPFRTVCSDR